MTGRTAPERLGLRAAPWLLWFGVVGSGVSWSLHTLVDWALEETVCRSGHTTVLGLALRPVLGVLTLVFLAVCVASTVVALVAWRRLDGAPAADATAALRQTRASVMALLGFVGGLLFSVMVLMGGIAVLVTPVCTNVLGPVAS